MGAAEIVLREVNLRAINVNVRIVGEGETNAVVESEGEFAVGHVIFEALRRGERRRSSLASVKAQGCLEWGSRLRVRRTNTDEHKQRERRLEGGEKSPG